MKLSGSEITRQGVRRFESCLALMVYVRQPKQQFRTLSGRTGKYRNFDITFPSTNNAGFPDVQGFWGRVPKSLVPYNGSSRQVLSPENAFHYYLSDYKFEVAWSDPARVLTRLMTTNFTLGPDFSAFTDWPLPVQIFNTYRNRWCCALWQAEGVRVIPNVGWGIPETYSWCFDGLPTRSVVAISTVGCVKYKHAVKPFLHGYDAMIERLQPTAVVCYGSTKVFSGREGTLSRESVPVFGYPCKWDTYKQEGVLS